MTPKVEPPKDDYNYWENLEHDFGFSAKEMDGIRRAIKLQQEALLSKLEAGIEQARVDGMFTEWNGLNLCDIDQLKSTINKLRLEL